MRKQIATTYIFLFYFLSFLQAQVTTDTTLAVFYIQQADSLFSQKKYDNTLLEIDKALETVSYTHLTLPTTPYV